LNVKNGYIYTGKKTPMKAKILIAILLTMWSFAIYGQSKKPMLMKLKVEQSS